jgi:hypothetical protein
MASPALATNTCPQCNGTRVERALGERDGRPVILETRCGTCRGTGTLPTFAVDAPEPDSSGPPLPELALWPFWVPLVFFLVFFLFLWL